MEKTKVIKMLKTVGVVREREREREGELKTKLFICDAKNLKEAQIYFKTNPQNDEKIIDINANKIKNTQNRDINNDIRNVNNIKKAKRMNYITKIQNFSERMNYSNKLENNPKGKEREVFWENRSSFLCTKKEIVKKNKIGEKDKYA